MKRVLLSFALLFPCLACGDEAAPAPSPAAPTAPGLDLTSQNPRPPGARRDTYDELMDDLAAPRHKSDGGGRAWIESGPLEIQARSRGRWTLAFETGPEGIQEGGILFLMISPFWGWSVPQNRSPAMPGFTTVTAVSTEDDDSLRLEPETVAGQMLAIHIKGRALAPGEVLQLIYGDSEAGAIADNYAERESRFWFAVDGDGDGVRSVVKDSPTVDILPGPAAQLLLTLPGTARPGETVRVTAALLDGSGSTGVDFEGELLIASDKRWPGLPERLALPRSAGGLAHFPFSIPKDGPNGVLRLVVAAVSGEKDKPQQLVAMSNPMFISEHSPRILWADLHGHSNLSDGTGTPEDYFSYARDVAALDVSALTDHDHWGVRFIDQTPELWERIGSSVKAVNNPGHFTSLLAFEWTNWIHGHRHVLYFGDEGEMISSVDPATDDPGELRDHLRAKNALTFAHHSAGSPVPVNWSFAPDPELEPVTEVSSVHGTSEAWDAPLRIRGAWRGNFVRDVLDAGATLGFIGSGDSHDGHPGLAQLASGTGGLAGLFAEENTREAVRASLKERACYATNGPRILLLAKLADSPMGRSVPAASIPGDATLDLHLFGTTPLVRLEVIRSGKIVATLDAAAMEQTQDTPPDFVAELPLESLGLKDLKPGEYAYLRVVEEGPGIAWSSAWFIE